MSVGYANVTIFHPRESTANIIEYYKEARYRFLIHITITAFFKELTSYIYIYIYIYICVCVCKYMYNSYFSQHSAVTTKAIEI